MVSAEQIRQSHPELEPVFAGAEAAWCNPRLLPCAQAPFPVSLEEIRAAEGLLHRFAPFLEAAFPETRASGGIIESPLTPIPQMQAAMRQTLCTDLPGRLFLKRDDQLPVAGSVKARGGIYEILKYAESLVQSAGLLQPEESYVAFASAEVRAFLSQYTVEVGSTGNLGLSIGIISAALGFHVIVHMSNDARQWKKELLRAKGVCVKEYAGDYGAAVAAGRESCQNDPHRYFVDDEHSIHLFLGYAVAALRLKQQLLDAAIPVDARHPLFVYLPCGVGGAPGGITYGLKRIFGDHVHCFFVEPVACPAMLLGLATGLHEHISVQDIGLSGKTDADGLAVGRPSGLVSRLIEPLVSGEFTVSDPMLYQYLNLLWQSERIAIEPSACAAFAGPAGLLRAPSAVRYLEESGLTAHLAEACHIAWATGGSLVPPSIMQAYRTLSLS